MVVCKAEMAREILKSVLLTFLLILRQLACIIFIISLFLASEGDPVWAQYVPPPYGEVAPTVQILIDKKIKNPESGDYVDNLGVNDYHFAPGEEIRFKIQVKNTGETTFGKIEVKDYLPEYVELVSGKTEIEYQDLKSDESYEFELLVKVVSAEKIPDDQMVYCVINKATVKANDQSDEDTAQLCIEKKVLGVAVQPEVGANLLVLGLGFLGISALGILLKVRERH